MTGLQLIDRPRSTTVHWLSDPGQTSCGVERRRTANGDGHELLVTFTSAWLTCKNCRRIYDRHRTGGRQLPIDWDAVDAALVTVRGLQ
tara:strand:- start:649 stop:912 length:264 start_codon:yes stop_codon:yes gene_type:complete